MSPKVFFLRWFMNAKPLSHSVSVDKGAQWFILYEQAYVPPGEVENSQIILTDEKSSARQKQKTSGQVFVRAQRRRVQNFTVCLENTAWTLTEE